MKSSEKGTEKQKICGNCDGRIPWEAAQCLYCGADVSKQLNMESVPYQATLFKHQSLEDSLTNLYKPPYGGGSTTTSTYSKPKEAVQERVMEETMIKENTISEVDQTTKNTLWSILFLSAGANLFILGLLQLFFSNGGILRLEWNAHYWFVYSLLSLPILYFGIKKLGKKEQI
ncbi:MAG: hypothetical protein HKM07_05025 [Chlamydiae bacterium]|nr:hypothetical protein [Chlamydiota bacterium]